MMHRLWHEAGLCVEVEAMRVTTVSIDNALLNEAREILGAATARSAVDQALRAVVMRHRQTQALDGLAALVLDLDPVKLLPMQHVDQ